MEKKFQDKIDQYLLGKLSGKELADFEKMISENPELAQNIQEQKDALEMIELVGDEKMRSQIKKVHEKMKTQSKPKNNGRMILLVSIAALIAFLLVWNFGFKSDKFNPQKIYTTHFEPFDLNLKRGGEKTLEAANIFYSNEEYEKAIPLLEEASKNSTDTKLQLVTGIAYLELGNTTKSISIFEKLIDANDPLYAHHAAWYTALSYLKNNDIAACKNYLSKAKNLNPSRYENKVKEVLEKLP